MKSFERVEDNTLMPFGSHAGKKMQDVPASWLIWFEKEARKREVRRPFTNGVLIYIEENRFLLEREAKKQTTNFFRKKNKYR